jgi:hypothetical protein
MAVGTVTGRDARIYMVSHNAAITPNWGDKASNSYLTYGIGDFSLTFGRDQISQNLIGVAGPYTTQGSITCDGSLTINKFGGNLDIILENLIDTGTSNVSTKFLAISGAVSTTDSTYLSFYLTSCQVIGYDVSIGDAGTITQASIDFIDMVPQCLTYAGGTVKG